MISARCSLPAVLGTLLALTACAQNGAVPPGSETFAQPGARHSFRTPPVADHAARRHVRSWMSPAAKRDDLLYVSYYAQGAVAVYHYPGQRQAGELTGFSHPEGLCADSAGHVYVLDNGNGSVFEYAHGGTSPIRTLTVSGGEPFECSVDPTSGHVAVTIATTGYYSGYVAVYPRSGPGNPQPYVAPNIYVYQYCGYDHAGNLYVDGYGYSGDDVKVAGLAHGAYSMAGIAPNTTIKGAGPVQWDGKFLAIGDAFDTVIQRYAIDWSSDKAIEAGSLQLAGYIGLPPGQWWIQGKRIVGPLSSSTIVEYWQYPSGAVQRYFDGLANDGWAATVSQAPR